MSGTIYKWWLFVSTLAWTTANIERGKKKCSLKIPALLSRPLLAFVLPVLAKYKPKP